MPELVELRQDEEEIEETDEKGVKHVKRILKGEPKPYSIHYHLLTPLLLNEIIRLNREISRLDQKNEQLTLEIDRLSHENKQIIQEK
jgi:hypothetical protein